MPRYDYVLFDADNTLYDFDLSEDCALEETLTTHGLAADGGTKARYREINSALWAAFDRGEFSDRDWLLTRRFAALLEAVEREGDPVAMNRVYLERLAQQADLLPGAEALCRALAPHCTLALVTNGVAAVQHGRYRRSPLAGLIPWLFISEEVGYSKPHPGFFAAVLAGIPILDPSRAVVVGDNLGTDVAGGLASGLDTVWFNPHRHPNETAIQATYEVASFPQLQALILC